MKIFPVGPRRNESPKSFAERMAAENVCYLVNTAGPDHNHPAGFPLQAIHKALVRLATVKGIQRFNGRVFLANLGERAPSKDFFKLVRSVNLTRARMKKAYQDSIRGSIKKESLAMIRDANGKRRAAIYCFCPEGELCHRDFILEEINGLI